MKRRPLLVLARMWYKRAESGPSAAWRAALASGFPEFHRHLGPTAEGVLTNTSPVLMVLATTTASSPPTS